MKRRSKVIVKRYKEKLTKLKFREDNNKTGAEYQAPNNIPRNVLHRFSTYKLSNDKLIALLCGLDQIIIELMLLLALNTFIESY